MEKIEHKVPHYHQEKGNTCGLACTRMLLAYFGHEVSEDEIFAETYMHKFGSWFSDLAGSFLKRGYKTKIYTINLNIYSPFWAGKSEEELRVLLMKREKELKGILKKEVQQVIQYLDLGGRLEVKIPNEKLILGVLEKQPIITPLCRSFIYPHKIDEVGHYLVVSGYDGENYFLLDPDNNDEAGKQLSVNKEIFEYSWLGTAITDDGYLMEITK